MQPIRAVTYYRKSNEDDGQSIDQQRAWAVEAAEREGIIILREFADQSVAGWNNAKRSDFHNMLAYCQEQHRLGNPVEAIVCWHTNRLSRADSLESARYLHEFRQVGVDRLRTRERWYDLRRKEDRALLNLEQDFTNQQYVVNLAADSLRGRLDIARNEGRWCGGPIPYGYRAEKEEAIGKHSKKYTRTKRLILGPDNEVAVVRWVFEQYATGEKGLRHIAESLNLRGIPTPRRKSMWSHQAIRNILQEEAYLGRTVWNRERRGRFFGVVGLQVSEVKPGKRQRNAPGEWIRKDGTHEPIISEELFHRCAAILARRGKARNPGKTEFTLTGLVRCGHCGSSMTGRNMKFSRRGKMCVYRRYECSGYMTSGKAKCHFGCVDSDRLAQAIIDKLLPPWLEQNVDALRAEILRQDRVETEPDQAQLEALRKRVEKIEQEIIRATEELVRTDSEKQIDRLRAVIRQKEKEQETAAAELREMEGIKGLQDPEAEVDAALAMLGRLRKAKDEGDLKAQKALLQEMVTKVEVYFNREQRAKRMHSSFAKALIWVPPDIWAVLSTVEASISTGSAHYRTHPIAIITTEDLAAITP